MPGNVQPATYGAAVDQRAQEVLQGVLNNDSLMTQIRESAAAVQRGEDGTPWDEVEAKARAARAG